MPLRFRLAAWLLAPLLALALSPTARATDPEACGPTDPDCVAVGHWNVSVALGAGARTNPVYGGTTLPLVIVPQISYYGRRLFLDNLDVGITLLEDRSYTLSLVASPGYDRVYFVRRDLQNVFLSGLPGNPQGPENQTLGATTAVPAARHTPAITYLAGPEVTFQHGRASGQLTVLHDVTGKDHGTEIRAALAYTLLERTGTLTATAGLTWKSAGIVDYYYGRAGAYIPGYVPLGAYEPGSALSPSLKLGYTHPLTKHWRLTALAEVEHLGPAIAHSPIVVHSEVYTVFAGATYAF